MGDRYGQVYRICILMMITRKTVLSWHYIGINVNSIEKTRMKAELDFQLMLQY